MILVEVVLLALSHRIQLVHDVPQLVGWWLYSAVTHSMPCSRHDTKDMQSTLQYYGMCSRAHV